MSSCRLELIPPASDTVCPLERSGHRVLVDDGHLYALGGYNPDVVDSDEEDEEELCKRIFIQMWRFNFFSRQWQDLQMTGECPQYLASHSASLHGNTLLTFGGSGIPFGTRSSESVHMCRLDPSSHTVHWRLLLAKGEGPGRKYGQCQLYEWPYLYIVGGTTGFVYNSDVHRFDLGCGEWTCLWDSQSDEDKFQTSPDGRYRHEMVIHNKQLLMFGGGMAMSAFPLDKIPYFDLTCNKWKEHQTTPDLTHRHSASEAEGDHNHVKGVPFPRRCHSCVYHNSGVYLFGGRNEDPLGDLWRLCLKDFQWTCLQLSQNSPICCYFHSAAATSSGYMYMFGGVTWTEDGLERRTNSVYRVKLQLPKLQELAWDCLSHQLHAVRSPSLRSELLSAGVPRVFMERLPS